MKMTFSAELLLFFTRFEIFLGSHFSRFFPSDKAMQKLILLFACIQNISFTLIPTRTHLYVFLSCDSSWIKKNEKGRNQPKAAINLVLGGILRWTWASKSEIKMQTVDSKKAGQQQHHQPWKWYRVRWMHIISTTRVNGHIIENLNQDLRNHLTLDFK